MKNVFIILLSLFLIYPVSINSPSSLRSTVTGTVVDENQTPIMGATVRKTGTTVGTTTDLDGNFYLDCTIPCTLVISYIGYETQHVYVYAAGYIGTIQMKPSVL